LSNTFLQTAFSAILPTGRRIQIPISGVSRPFQRLGPIYLDKSLIWRGTWYYTSRKSQWAILWSMC